MHRGAFRGAPAARLNPRAPVSDTIHATTLVLARYGVMIRGASGAGKSTLAHALLHRRCADLNVALVSDDRTRLHISGGRLIAQAPQTLAGLIEVRGIGIVTVAHTAPAACIDLVVDLTQPQQAPRMPEADHDTVTLHGIRLDRVVLPDATFSTVTDHANTVLTRLGLTRVTSTRAVATRSR